MKRKVVMSLMIGALSVSMLSGCGSDKEVTKVDDNTVQITDGSTEADNGTESTDTASTEEAANDIIYGDVVEDLGLDVVELDSKDEIIVTVAIARDGEYTDETTDITSVCYLQSLDYVEEYADLMYRPSKEGYVTTFFEVTFIPRASWNAVLLEDGVTYNAVWSAYDRNTGICLTPSSHDYGTGGESVETVTIIAEDGTEYDCTYASSWENEADTGYTILAIVIEHPEDYDPSNIIFAVGGRTASSVAYDETLDTVDSNLRDLTELWSLRGGNYYTTQAKTE